MYEGDIEAVAAALYARDISRPLACSRRNLERVVSLWRNSPMFKAEMVASSTAMPRPDFHAGLGESFEERLREGYGVDLKDILAFSDLLCAQGFSAEAATLARPEIWLEASRMLASGSLVTCLSAGYPSKWSLGSGEGYPVLQVREGRLPLGCQSVLKYETIGRSKAYVGSGHSAGVNGHSPDVNGHSSGVNGHSPGDNGHSSGVNGYSSGVNGYLSGVNGHSAGVNGHSPGVNGHSPGLNDHSPGLNGHSPGVKGDSTEGNDSPLRRKFCEVFAKPFLGVVGSRRIDPPREELVRAVVRAAASRGFRICSGGAPGTDRAAIEEAALFGPSFELWPCGVSQRWGVESGWNQSQTALKGRFALPLVGSFVARNEPFDRRHAMERNAALYSMSEATFVAHARFKEGGSWHGAVTALRRRLTRVIVPADGSAAHRSLISLGAIAFDLSLPVEIALEQALSAVPLQPWLTFHSHSATPSVTHSVTHSAGPFSSQHQAN